MNPDSENASDLALAASLKAIEAAGITPADIDLIIVATTTADMVFPSTACLLQAKLGVGNGPAFDMQAVCSGFVYATATADQRALALNRAIRCYGPSGYNSCGGVEVPVEQRRAWFQRLKRDYPNSRWAQSLRYYW